MIPALLGTKIGMTQVVDERGAAEPVTVVKAGPCVVLRVRSKETDGYDAVQLGFGAQKEQRVSRPQLARYRKAGAAPCRVLREFPVETDEEAKEGQTVDVSIFDGISYVDVVGISKGRGFQGVVKRYRMAGGRMTHGGHSRRRIGSIGQCSYPARVAKGKRMPGHMGNVRVKQRNLRVVQARGEDSLLLVRGSIPGPTGGFVLVQRALKNTDKGNE